MKYRLVVLLSGCGMYDGSDPQETVLGLYFAEKHGFEPVCVAPTGKSLHVMSHLSGESISDEGYDLFEMSSRLMKGKLMKIDEVPGRLADALFIPGGQGVIKNLMGGLGGEPNAGALELVRAVAERKRPILAVSLAELLVNRATGQALAKGCFDFPADAVYEEEERNIFLTPGFTAARTLTEAAIGIEKMFELARKNLDAGGQVLPVMR